MQLQHLHLVKRQPNLGYKISLKLHPIPNNNGYYTTHTCVRARLAKQRHVITKHGSTPTQQQTKTRSLLRCTGLTKPFFGIYLHHQTFTLTSLQTLNIINTYSCHQVLQGHYDEHNKKLADPHQNILCLQCIKPVSKGFCMMWMD